MATKTLFSGQSADADSSAVTVRSDTTQVHEETLVVEVSGNLGGGTVTLQGCLDLDESPQSWVDLGGGEFTEAAMKLARLGSGTSMRASLSGSSGASVTVRVRGDI